MHINRLRCEVPIELDGITYIMRPSFEALAAIEAKLSQSMIQIADKVSNEAITIHEIAIIIEICMAKHTSAAFIEAALVRGGLGKAICAVSELMLLVFGGVDEE